jgi:regulator of sirC expression with transglutaminase-like and TPR domain
VSVADAADLLEQFRALGQRRDLDLFEGALLIAALVDPDENPDEARRLVAAMAARVAEAGDRGEPLLAALRRVLFEEEAFKGDEESYDEPSNSSVARVLSRRRGMPITLSIVTIEVARLAGLRLTGVGLPGHFVVGGPDLPEGMFLDPFDGGALYEVGGLSRRLGAIFGSPVALGPEILRPDPPRAILSRVLVNLRRSLERRERWEEAFAALDFAQALEPKNGSLLRERGLLLLKCGRAEEALAALEEFAAGAQGEDAEAVTRLIEAIRSQGSATAEEDQDPERKIFTLGEARELLPRVRELTSEAVERYGSLSGQMEEERQLVVREWMRELRSLGLEIKGLWLVDFDSGAGYYCWKYPEPALNHFHGYDEGFSGRLSLQ